MLETLILFGHLVVASLIIALVLLQRGKGAEAGTGFGAGASGTVFGSRGTSSFFSRATAVLATLFFATSLSLAYFSSQTPTATLDSSVTETPGTTRGPGEVAGQSELSDLPDAELDDGALDDLPSLDNLGESPAGGALDSGASGAGGPAE